MPQVIRSIEINAPPRAVWPAWQPRKRYAAGSVRILRSICALAAHTVFSDPIMRHGSAVVLWNWSQRKA